MSFPEQLSADDVADKELQVELLCLDAVIRQTAINDADLSPEDMHVALVDAVNDLDNKSVGLIMGESVEVSGHYLVPLFEPFRTKFGQSVSVESTYRRGQSLGFEQEIIAAISPDGTVEEGKPVGTLFHHLYVGNVVINNLFMRNATVPTVINAPVHTSTIRLVSAIEFEAHQEILNKLNNTSEGSKWRDIIDRFIYREPQINLRRIGAFLDHVSTLSPDHASLLAEYVNDVVGLKQNPVEVYCDYGIQTLASSGKRTVVNLEGVAVSCVTQGIMLVDGFAYNPKTDIAKPVPRQMAALAAQVIMHETNEEGILHVPLARIKAHDLTRG
ncbi:MAG: hypothetical protein JWM81_914 [Candidatus Saccharibacteria bacterium]|nr:hypothetical protein [Candidatus Saccharibacteria bacterium]